MMMLFDDNELRERKREQMYGNMYLITELYTANLLNGNIIKTCLDDLQQEINDQNIEIMVYMAQKLMANLVKHTKTDLKNAPKPVQQKKSGQKVINLDYVDNFCQKLFSFR